MVLGGAALAAGAGLLSPSLPQNDAWTHFLHLRVGLTDPRALLDPWDRPGFTLLYASASAFGIHAARLVSAVLAVVAAAGTVRAARGLGLRHAWLAGLFFLAQYDVFGQAGSTMTELPFAASFAVALVGVVERRPWVAAAGLAWCGVTRPEGPLFSALGAAWLLLRERQAWPAAAALAGFPFYFAAGAAAFGDPLWLVTSGPYRGLVGARFELRQLWESWFFGALGQGQPPALRALEAAGAVAVLRDRTRGRSGSGPSGASGPPGFGHLLFLLAPLLASYLLLTFLRIGPSDAWRESRYLVTVAPALALLAAAGLDALLAVAPRLVPAVFLYVTGWSAVWAIAWHWRPAGDPLPPDAAALAYLVAGLGAAAGALSDRVPPRAALAALLALPLAAAPPGAWAKHRRGQTPGLAPDGLGQPAAPAAPAADR